MSVGEPAPPPPVPQSGHHASSVGRRIPGGEKGAKADAVPSGSVRVRHGGDALGSRFNGRVGASRCRRMVAVVPRLIGWTGHVRSFCSRSVICRVVRWGR